MYKLLFLFPSCKKSGPVNIMYNLIKNIDRDTFIPILMTIYREEENSMLDCFLKLNIDHFCIETSKIDIILGKTKKVKDIIKGLNPDIIHSMGVFPDYMVSKMRVKNQFITLHNYMYEDYVMKFGKIKGKVLIKLHSFSINHARSVVTCSKSLSDMYREKRKMIINYIRNGIDVSMFFPPSSIKEKNELRKKLSIGSKFCFVYAGQFIDRKNQEFLINVFKNYFDDEDYLLLLLGDGVNFKSLKAKYRCYKSIRFTGNVDNVSDYLKASDFYISSSLSEGLPTGVLEAMACGLPVILSNIPQHIEILDESNYIGKSFINNDYNSCVETIKQVVSNDYKMMSNASIKTVKTTFSANRMCSDYQEAYLKIIKEKEN